MRLLTPLRFSVGCVLVLANLFISARAQDGTVARAYVGKDGLVHVVLAAGGETVAAPEKYPEKGGLPLQASVDNPIIAADGRTVGWIVNFDNCCTSYPIPLILAVYRDGRVIQRLTPSDYPPMILDWHFVAGGKQIAISTGPLHGDDSSWAFELYAVATGRLIQRWDGNSRGPDPAWVQAFSKQ